ncbi:hypothetical protein FRC08_008905 [Ceratobasidium sp. 394]|nr:hypothetical protein FRC08_008905 [Ceratobasidium sp. 394]
MLVPDMLHQFELGAWKDFFTHLFRLLGAPRDPGSWRTAQNISLTKQFSKEPKSLNINTYKFHALGDVVKGIRLFGSTNSYTTQIGELEHRRVTARAQRTNRNDIACGLATLEYREAFLIAQAQQLENLERQPWPGSSTSFGLESKQVEKAPASVHHHIAYTGERVRFIDFLDEH